MKLACPRHANVTQLQAMHAREQLILQAHKHQLNNILSHHSTEVAAAAKRNRQTQPAMRLA